MEKNAFLMGWNNAVTASREDCPFHSDTIAHFNWWRGWNAAVDEAVAKYV